MSLPEPTPPKFRAGQKLLHVRSGKEFLVLSDPSSKIRIEQPDVPSAYVYSSLDGTGYKWVRTQTDMEDGRFVLAPVQEEPSVVTLASKMAFESTNCVFRAALTTVVGQKFDDLSVVQQQLCVMLQLHGLAAIHDGTVVPATITDVRSLLRNIPWNDMARDPELPVITGFLMGFRLDYAPRTMALYVTSSVSLARFDLLYDDSDDGRFTLFCGSSDNGLNTAASFPGAVWEELARRLAWATKIHFDTVLGRDNASDELIAFVESVNQNLSGDEQEVP